MYKRCSDVVESRVEHAILDAESRRNAAFTSDLEQPWRSSPWGTRGLRTKTRYAEPALPIEELGELSNDQRKKIENGLLEQPPESKAKISHHINSSNVRMRQWRSWIQIRDNTAFGFRLRAPKKTSVEYCGGRDERR